MTDDRGLTHLELARLPTEGLPSRALYRDDSDPSLRSG